MPLAQEQNMAKEYSINASDLKESEKIEALRAFLEKRLKDKPITDNKTIRISFKEGSEIPKKDLRLLLKKFLHSENLKEDFRLLSEEPDSFRIRKRA